jgi:6-phosphogluconolactonase
MIKINSFPSFLEAAHGLTKALLKQINQSAGTNFHLAISGGNTPSGLFRLWAEEYKEVIPWKRLQLYWVDERCVPPDHPESNYGMAKRIFLDQVPLTDLQIHRIHGEEVPDIEAKRYSILADNLLTKHEIFPVFDCILLGIGDDGHTSSIFPGQNSLLISSETYAVSVNPQTGMKRVALTGLPIIHARNVFFFVAGKGKKEILNEVIKGDDKYPAGYIISRLEKSELFTDSL